MNSILALREEYNLAMRHCLEARNKAVDARNDVVKSEEILSDINYKLFFLTEIYIHAQEQFGRIRRTPAAPLTAADVAELEKWIGRTKNVDGLKAIWTAILELKRFRPIDIRRNLYALVQKIIIEGPRHV